MNINHRQRWKVGRRMHQGQNEPLCVVQPLLGWCQGTQVQTPCLENSKCLLNHTYQEEVRMKVSV